MDGSEKTEIKLSSLFEKGIAVFLILLVGYFLFYFSVFSKNSFTLPGFILIILFAFFFLEYAIYIFVFTLPLLSLLPELLNLPLFSPSELLFLCLLGACLLKVILNQKRPLLFQTPVDLPILILSFVLIASFLSTFTTHYPSDLFYKEKVLGVLKRILFIYNPHDYSYIFTSTFNMLEGVMIFFLVTNFVRERKVLNRISFLLIGGWGTAILLGFIQYFGAMPGGERWPTRMCSMFNNPNLFAGYLVLIFPLALFYAFNSFSLLRVPLWIITSLSIIALVLSRSKNAWMAFALLLICMGIFFVISYARKGENTSSGTFFNWKWISVFTVCFIMILGSFCFTLKKGTVSEILKEDLNWNVPIEQKLDIRLALWKHAVQMIEDFPLFGVGTGRFNLAFPRYSSGYPWDKAVITPHNHFLKITAELGLLGLYAFLWMVWTILAKGFQIIRQKQDVISRGVWFGILGFVLTFFGDNHLWNIEMQLLFFLMLGLLFVDEGRDETARVHPGSFNQKLLAGLSAIILLTLPFQIYQRSHISFLSERSLGLYQEKFNDGEREYQWGEKVILIPLEKEGNRILIPMKLGNPDIQRHPVQVKIFFDGQLADTLEFRDHDWHLLRYSIHGMKGPEVFLKIEASRTWNPYLSGVRHETRDLGPALGKIAWSS